MVDKNINWAWVSADGDGLETEALVKELSLQALAGRPYFTLAPDCDSCYFYVCTANPITDVEANELYDVYFNS